MSGMAPLFASLFPAGVVVEVAHEADAALALLSPAELACTGGMIPARVREFAQGRNAARRALASLGVPPTALVPAAGDRHPAWPRGVTGSISHTRGLCAAAATRVGLLVEGGPVYTLGLDVEGAEPLEHSVARELCRPDELAALEAGPAPAPGWPKLVFAMKEAAYKAWYPETRTTLAFEEMVVSARADGAFDARIVSGKAREGLALRGRFSWSGEFVAAGALLLQA